MPPRREPRDGAPPRARRARRTAGQRAGISRELVLAAAGRIIKAEGLDQLSMRRLAAELGVAPNALYTYVPTKTALLDALLDDVLATVRLPTDGARDWRDDLAALMRASRRALLANPQLVPLFVARPGGVRAQRLGEAALRFLARGGVGGRRAVEALRALLVYTLGFAAVEVPRITDPAGARRLAEAAERIRMLDAAEYPHTRALATQLAKHPDDRDFEAGLAWLLAGIAGESKS